jgi:hypothetical protein
LISKATAAARLVVNALSSNFDKPIRLSPERRKPAPDEAAINPFKGITGTTGREDENSDVIAFIMTLSIYPLRHRIASHLPVSDA